MSGLVVGISDRGDDLYDTTKAYATGGLIIGTITRATDKYELQLSKSWTASNTWQDILTPLTGETGDIRLIFTDTADSNKKHFQVFKYNKTSSTVIAFTTSGTVGVVDFGESTIKLQVQNSSGTIQVLHTAGANRTCSVKIGFIRHA
jgi:hypothetical protein